MSDDFKVSSGRLVSFSALAAREICSPSAGESARQASGVRHGLPLAHEIRHALQRLLETGEETAIDLARLPLAPADEAMLRGLLGFGEVKAELNAIGRSFICETAISGVWWVEHYGTDGQSLGRFVEITPIPTILKSQPQDMREALTRLTEHLSEGQE